MSLEIPHSHLPYGSDGSGFYSDNTIGCYDVIDSAHILHSVEEVLKNHKPRVFTIVDYGAADGGTSMSLIYSCVEKIKQLCGEEQEILVIYEDQPTNDFKSLLLRLQGLIRGPKSYLSSYKNVFVTCSGTSFYRQCFPSGTVHLGFSATCMHWLQKKPCNITNGIHHTQITRTEEKTLFQEQARLDWEEILLQRAKEMMPGSRMVLLQLCVDDNGYHLGNTNSVKKSMFSVMDEVFKKMVVSGRITNDEYANITFANYYRTVQEYSAPFHDHDSFAYKCGLRLVSISTKIVDCPYLTKWLSEGGDSKAHAKWFVPTTRTWSNHTIFSALDGERSEEERTKIVDEFFQLYEEEVTLNPSEHGMPYVHAHIIIEKVEETLPNLIIF